MVDTIVHGTGDSSSQPPVPRTKHIGLLTAESVALYIDMANDPFIFQLARDLTFGRHAPNMPIQPVVDLTAFSAYEKGVSRLHAVVRRRSDGGIQVEDLASGNGTWLNGIRLEPHSPRLLKSGDRLTLGKLLIEVYLAEPKAEQAPKPDTGLFNTLQVIGGTQGASETPPVLLLAAPTPKPCACYHAAVSVSVQRTVPEISAILLKLLPHFLKLKDCEIKLSLHVDVHLPSSFDDATMKAVQAAATDLKLDESEFKSE